MLAKVRFWAFLALFALLTTTCMLPHGWYILLDNRRSRRSEAEARMRISEWWGLWAALHLWVFQKCLRVRIVYQIDKEALIVLRTEPCILIANHQSTLDALLYPALFWKIGWKNIRAVFKQELFRAPFFGRFFRASGSIAVRRGRDPKDLDRMRAGAARARRDGASFVLFPEGTRSHDGKLLAPKSGGLEILVKRMKLPIISVLTTWDVYPVGARTMFDGAAYVGRTITVRIGPPARLPGSRRLVQKWLTKTWETMAEEMTQQQTKTPP